MTPADYIAGTLEAAAKRLETLGWIQGLFQHGDRCCAEGAINIICGLSAEGIWPLRRVDLRDLAWDTGKVFGRWVDALYGPYDSWMNRIALFNDAPDRTVREVVTELRTCAWFLAAA